MKLSSRAHLVLPLFLCSELLRLNLGSAVNQYCTSRGMVSSGRYLLTQALNEAVSKAKLKPRRLLLRSGLRPLSSAGGEIQTSQR